LRLTAPGSGSAREPMTAVSKSGTAPPVIPNVRDQNEWDKAIAEYTRMLGINPDNVSALNNRGLAYAHKGEYEATIADFTAALAIKPDYYTALYNRAYAYYQMGEPDKAIADCNAALTIKNDFPEVITLRGWAHSCNGDYKKAVADYTASVDAQIANMARATQDAGEKGAE